MTTQVTGIRAPDIVQPERSRRRSEKRARRWQRRRAKLARRHPPCKSRLGESGTVRGSQIEPGSIEADWVTPPSVTLHGGTSVRLFKDGQGLTAALAAIRAAKSQVCLEVYIFHSDDTGRAFADALAAKATSGVRVFVIYDSFGSIDSDPSMFQQMRDAGVRLSEFHPLRPWDCKHTWRPGSRDHRKLLVIDGNIVGLGGLNVGAEYGSGFLAPRARKCDLWRDNGIGIVGPAACIFQEAFNRTWRYLNRGGKVGKAQTVYNISLGDRPKFRAATARRLAGKRDTSPAVLEDVGVLASVPTVNSPLVPFLLQLVRGARRSIDLTIAYFAPSDVFIGELCRAARRGVHVRLMLPGRCDVLWVRFAARSFYETLLGAGVEVWERQGAVLHAKTMVIDESVSIVGSLNLDYRSIEYNLELSAVIRSPEFGLQMTALFQHDTHFAERIKLGVWRRRPLRDRIVQWIASRARYLL